MHGGSIALQASESERERSPQALPAVTQRIALRLVVHSPIPLLMGGDTSEVASPEGATHYSTGFAPCAIVCRPVGALFPMI